MPAHAALSSNAGIVVLEAAAGCGKTYEGAQLAAAWARNRLEPRFQVLVLAHTNAAVEEFRRRARALQVTERLRATTFDSFAVELLRPYPLSFGFPHPLERHLGRSDGPRFEELGPAAADLLRKAPTLARLLARKHPLVILDEHQDSTPAQHAMALALVRAGAELRIFGDPMQAIYEGGTARSLVDWPAVHDVADTYETLEEPQRWREVPNLGRWIMRARAALEAGHAVPLDNMPASVRVRRIPGMECAGWGRGNPQDLSRPLHEFLDESGEGSIAILARGNNLVEGIVGTSRNRVIFNEGADYSGAHDLAERAVMHAGNAQAIARSFLELVKNSSKGFSAQYQRSVEGRLSETGVRLVGARGMTPLLVALQEIWHAPNYGGVRRAAEQLLREPPAWLTLRKPQALAALAAARGGAGVDPRDVLAAEVKARKLRARRPWRCASTIHKAKGLQFHRVMLVNASADHFPNEEQARRLAYVAISRATHALTVLVPGESPSPLFHHRHVTS